MIKNAIKGNIPAILTGEGIPIYSEINAEQINKHIPILIRELEKQLNSIESMFDGALKNHNKLTWEEVMSPLHELNEKLRWSWGAVSHLNSVCNSEDLRNAYSKNQPEVIKLINRIGQSKIIYKALNKLRDESLNLLDEAQQRILQTEISSMNQKGVGLDGKIKADFNNTSERLAELSNKFSNNVLDATKEWSLLLTEKSDIDGLPDRALIALSEKSKNEGDLGPDCKTPDPENGPWRLGLDMPSYIAFMTYGTNRSIREKLYKAHIKRASNENLNNSLLIDEILSLRSEQSKRLGYQNWAELSLESKMAKDVEDVEKLLEELRVASLATAKLELNELQEFANRHTLKKKYLLAPWDLAFWSERLKQEKFNLNQEKLRAWFPLPKVLEGLFSLCKRLFGVKIVAADGEAPIWHKDVRFFKVENSRGVEIAYFYLDPYSRPSNKRGGAWMDECLGKCRTKNGKDVLPVAYLVCNQTPPSPSTPSLMSFEEVETLFHEFGHGLQHMLTKVEYPEAAGINNVEWDAVELPSQFMENWCLDQKTLLTMARHWETNEPLPEEEFNKLKMASKFNAGLSTLRQIHFALTDIRLHSQWDKRSGISPDDLRRRIATGTTVIPPIKEDRFLCSFNHIFAGGYSAGYYSYKWAEVLSADAFSAFEEIDPNEEEKIRKMGVKFKDTILSLGGSKSPREIFKAFRGRDANTEALIRHSGLQIINNN